MRKSVLVLAVLPGLLLSLAHADALHDGGVQPAYKDLMKLTERGLEPKEVVLPVLDGSVFFLNATKGGLASLSVDFKDKNAHCASPNVTFEAGSFRSSKPIGPNDFAVICFPDKGRYAVRAQGLDGTTRIYEGTVLVE